MAWRILTRVKERLTGAVILVALIVLLVPELLTGPASAVRVGQAPGLSVAAGPLAAGRAVRSYTLPLEPPGRASAGGVAAPASASRTLSQAMPSAASGTTRRLQGRAGRAQNRVSAAVSGPQTAPQADREASRSRSSARWVVQVGVFAVHGDALRMQRRVRALGIPSRIERMSLRGRMLWRVSAGPVAGARAAQALARRLRAQGIKGVLLQN
jgi:cell division septation protein DedD